METPLPLQPFPRPPSGPEPFPGRPVIVPIPELRAQCLGFQGA
jgi:hypothetical protein